MKSSSVGTDLFSGTFAILAALFFANYQPMKEAKKAVLSQQLINKKAKNKVTNLKTQKANIGALLRQTKGAEAKVLKFKQGLRSQASKLRAMKRSKCGDINNVSYRLKNGSEEGVKIAVNNQSGARYVCESYGKLLREGKLTSGRTQGWGSTSSAGR